MNIKHFIITLGLQCLILQGAWAQMDEVDMEGLEPVTAQEIENNDTVLSEEVQDDNVEQEVFLSSGNRVTATTYNMSAPREIDRVYTIVEGDTLWDVCSLLMDNPYYWPKLWSLNQYILNPHLIFPGQKLVFTPGTESTFPNLEIMDEDEDFPMYVEQAAPAPKKPLEKIYEPLPDPFGDTLIEESFATGVGVSVRLRNIHIMAPKRVKTVGKVVHSVEPRVNLVYGDQIYLEFDSSGYESSVEPGDRFHVIERVKRVPNPSGAGNIGQLIKKLAVVEVTQIRTNPNNKRKKAFEAKIIEGDDALVRGQELMEYRSDLVSLVPHYTEEMIKGRIAEADKLQMMISNNDFIFLNIGAKDGLEEGVQLYVLRRGDGTGMGNDRGLPDVPVGRVMIVETWDTTATAYVVTLDQQLEIGDRVQTVIEQ